MKLLRGDLWRRPEFMKVWTAQTLSEFGARFARDGLPLTAVLVLGSNPRQVGLLAALATAPRMVIGLLAGAVSFAIPLTSARPVAATVILSFAQFAGDGFSTIGGVTINTLRQSLFKPDRLGRIGSVFQVLDGAAAMLGALTGGLLGQAFGPRTAMLAASAGLTAATLWALFSPLRTLRETPKADPA